MTTVEVLLRIRHLLHIRAQHQQLARQKDTLEETVAARTGELRSTLGKLEGTVARLRDTQQQVIQHERLSALGSMAAGLAHDFNNALSLILGYSELLQTDLEGSPYEVRSDEFLSTIIGAAAGRRQDVQPAAGLLSSAGQRREPAAGGRSTKSWNAPWP